MRYWWVRNTWEDDYFWLDSSNIYCTKLSYQKFICQHSINEITICISTLLCWSKMIQTPQNADWMLTFLFHFQYFNANMKYRLLQSRIIYTVQVDSVLLCFFISNCTSDAAHDICICAIEDEFLCPTFSSGNEMLEAGF